MLKLPVRPNIDLHQGGDVFGVFAALPFVCFWHKTDIP